MPAHGDLFRCGLGVHVHNDHFHVGRNPRELACGRAERIVDGRHEGAPLQVEDGVACAVFRAADVEAAAGRAFRKICRAQQARLARKILDDFLPLPDVISAGEHIGARREKFLGDPRRDAETGSGILAVDDAQIDLALREDVREPVVNDLAAGRADDIADEKYSQFVESVLFTGGWLTLERSGPLRRAC